jgi:hypothetical protein
MRCSRAADSVAIQWVFRFCVRGVLFTIEIDLRRAISIPSMGMGSSGAFILLDIWAVACRHRSDCAGGQPTHLVSVGAPGDTLVHVDSVTGIYVEWITDRAPNVQLFATLSLAWDRLRVHMCGNSSYRNTVADYNAQRRVVIIRCTPHKPDYLFHFSAID